MIENIEVQQVEDQEIDLLEVFHILCGKAWILVVSFIAGALLVGMAVSRINVPQYEAASIIYIFPKITSISSLADIQLGSTLAADFQIIATTREVVEAVIDDCGIEGSYESVVSDIQVTNPPNSHMLRITVVNPDPQLAARISNSLADQLRYRIADVMSTDTPSTVERAVAPKDPIGSNIGAIRMIGGLVFLLLASGAVLLAHFLNDTIKDERDVTRYLGLDTLAAIPLEHAGKVGRTSAGTKPAG